MLNLLTQHDQAKLTLLNYFETKNTIAVPLWQLEEVLNLSSFKTTNLINELSDDLYQYSFGLIEIGQNKTVTPYNITNELINKFKLFYLKNSPLFKLYTFFYSEEKNFPLLIKEIGMSQASAYNQIKQLNKQLATYNMKIHNQKLDGPERMIRLRSFEVLIFFFKGIERPFDPKIKKSVNQLLHVIIKHIDFSPSYSMRLKLEYFIAVSITRIQLNNCISEQGVLELKKGTSLSSDRLYAALNTTFKQLFNKITDQNAHMECLYLIEFLIAESLLTTPDTLNGFSTNKSITNLTSYFITLIEQACHSKDDFLAAEQKLYQETSASFIKHSDFNYQTDSFNNEKINQQFTELYITESNLITDFILKHAGGSELTSDTLPLFYDLLFLIITHIPNNAFQSPLHICVDFSRSPTYTSHIKNKIRSFDSLKIIFDPDVTDKTDLYVSDFANYNTKTPQIIWKDPPSVNDWRIFGDTLIAIRKDK